MYFTIWTEKIENHGEDAPPTLLFQSPQTGILAVYDGLGGAGSKTYKIVLEDGEEVSQSGAYLASRFAKSSIEYLYTHSNDLYSFVSQLEDTLKEDFVEYAKSIEGEPSKLKSKLIRTLPTTLAGIYFDYQKSSNSFIINSFWAGDSRNYLLTDTKGIQQISLDDLHKQPDALENIWQDATLSNCIDASSKFIIHHQTLELSKSFILISATDGCFGYLPSPMHFEYILLKTLMDSFYDIEDWKEKLIHILTPLASDDVSLGLVVLGVQNLNALKVHFFPRYQYIYHHFIAPWEDLEDTAFETETFKKEAQRQLWQVYRENYYALIEAE